MPKPPAEVGVSMVTDVETVTLTWRETRVATGGPHAGKTLKHETTVTIPRWAFAAAASAWHHVEGA